MRRCLLALMLCGTVAAGCGSGADSNSGYAADLDTACAEDISALSRLPQLQEAKDLTAEQLQPYADRIGAEFMRAIKSIRESAAD